MLVREKQDQVKDARVLRGDDNSAYRLPDDCVVKDTPVLAGDENRRGGPVWSRRRLVDRSGAWLCGVADRASVAAARGAGAPRRRPQSWGRRAGDPLPSAAASGAAADRAGAAPDVASDKRHLLEAIGGKPFISHDLPKRLKIAPP
jgi:hypothetical protein